MASYDRISAGLMFGNLLKQKHWSASAFNDTAGRLERLADVRHFAGGSAAARRHAAADLREVGLREVSLREIALIRACVANRAGMSASWQTGR